MSADQFTFALSGIELEAEGDSVILAGIRRITETLCAAGSVDAVEAIAHRGKHDLMRPVIIKRGEGHVCTFLPAPALLRHLAKAIESL